MLLYFYIIGGLANLYFGKYSRQSYLIKTYYIGFVEKFNAELNHSSKGIERLANHHSRSLNKFALKAQKKGKLKL